MSKDDLLKLLRKDCADPEQHHSDCEDALLAYLNDPEITAAWEEASEEWWYA